MFGDTGRFKLPANFPLVISEEALRPKGVFVPFDDAPDASFSPSLALPLSLEPFFSSSFFLSSSFLFSSSVVSPSLYQNCQCLIF
jgi:hypothetical protein